MRNEPRINREELRKIIFEILDKKNCPSSMGIRGTNYDDVIIGKEIERNSYYWNHEWDHSSCVDDEPDEMSGVCASKIISYYHARAEDWQIEEIIDEIEERVNWHTNEYFYDHTYLVVGNETNDVPNDMYEIIIKDAVAVYKF